MSKTIEAFASRTSHVQHCDASSSFGIISISARQDRQQQTRPYNMSETIDIFVSWPLLELRTRGRDRVRHHFWTVSGASFFEVFRAPHKSCARPAPLFGPCRAPLFWSGRRGPYQATARYEALKYHNWILTPNRLLWFKTLTRKHYPKPLNVNPKP